MLFEFNFFWKFAGVMLLTWGFYGLWGFEFTLITLIGVILVLLTKKRSYF
jgi:hypothetical protein